MRESLATSRRELQATLSGLRPPAGWTSAAPVGENPRVIGPLARLSRTLVFVTVPVAGALAAAAVTLGAGDAEDPVHVCVSMRSGAARVVNASGHCRSTERAVSWNARGLQGAAGSRGIRGAQGPQGTGGAAGATGAAGRAGQPGAKGQTGTFVFDSFSAMPCDRNGQAGTIAVSYDSAGEATFTCS